MKCTAGVIALAGTGIFMWRGRFQPITQTAPVQRSKSPRVGRLCQIRG
jgi:hypothetical protein